MAKKIDAYGNIKAGKLFISYRDRFDSALTCWPDCRVRVKVEKIYKKRSLPQNSFYWGVLLNEFCDGYLETTGEKVTPEQAHDFLKNRFNSKEVTNENTGEVIYIPQTTSELTTVNFMEYQENCIKFIAEFFGRAVPEPGEQKEIF
jgi:hypothetical protein